MIDPGGASTIILTLSKLSLALHIAGGALGLSAGGIALLSTKERGIHDRMGRIYHLMVAVVCLSAAILAVLHWEKSAYLFFVSLYSYAWTFFGYRAAIQRRPGWKKRHVMGMVNSYMTQVAALVIVNLPRFEAVPATYRWVPWFFFPIVSMVWALYLIRRL